MGKNRFKPAMQLVDLKLLQKDGYISGLQHKWTNFRNTMVFEFNLTNQDIEGEKVDVNFENYHLRIEYKKTLPPKIFIVHPTITKRKHMYKDGSLCLYHRNNFRWENGKSISKDLIPWVFMWVYYYVLWLKSGIWYGEEYKH